MYILGKDIFTVESVNRGKPELKPDVSEAAEVIKVLMKDHGIIEVKI